MYVYYGNGFFVCVRLHCVDNNPFTNHAKDVFVWLLQIPVSNDEIMFVCIRLHCVDSNLLYLYLYIVHVCIYSLLPCCCYVLYLYLYIVHVYVRVCIYSLLPCCCNVLYNLNIWSYRPIYNFPGYSNSIIHAWITFCGWGITETTVVSLITIVLYKIQDFTFLCWRVSIIFI